MSKLVKEFKRWLKARYSKPDLSNSKNLRDKADKKLREIEKILKEKEN